MNKKNISLIINVIIVILEIVGITISYNVVGRISVEYYTIDSNILALFSSLLYVIFLIQKKKIPKWLSNFKYLTTIGLSITFLVVLFILIPMGKFDFYKLLISDSLLCHHTLCPILAFISFVFFDDIKKITKKDSVYNLSFTFLYSVVLINLNIFNVVIGPYPFLMVKNQTIISSILWFVILFLLAYIIAISLRLLNKKYNH